MEKYNKIKLLGHGLFSQVLSAKIAADDNNNSNNNLVALKITVPEDEGPPHNSRNELRILKLLQQAKSNCDHVISLLDSFEHSSEELELVMVLPYLPYDLKSIIKQHRKAKYPRGWQNNLPAERAYDIIIGICKALEFLHDEHHIIHRDIKPENILFVSKTAQPVLIDFGIAWIAPDNNGQEPFNKKITDVGTTIYRAPELLFAISSYSSAIDMWALGCVIGLMFSDDGTAGLFEPFHGDIALLGSQVDLIGPPTVDTWPDISGNESFLHMNFSDSNPTASLSSQVPLANVSLLRILRRLLTFQSTDRLTASQLRNQIESLL